MGETVGSSDDLVLISNNDGVGDGNIRLRADPKGSGLGDIVFETNGVERWRLNNSGAHLFTATGSGHTVTFAFSGTSDADSGTQGIRLSRDSAVLPVGITLISGGTALWDTATLDATTTDLVLAYDHSKLADIVRLRQGGYMLFSDSSGQPSTAHRLHLKSSSSVTDANVQNLIYMELPSGSTAEYMRGQFNSVENFNVTKDGKAGFGAVFSGEIAAGTLETKRSVSIVSTDLDSTLRLRRYGTSTGGWDLTSNAADANSFTLTDLTTTRSAIYVQAGFPNNNAIFVRSNGVVDLSGKAVATLQKAGTPVDGDWSAAPPNGTIVVDSTGNKIWARVGGAWKGVVIA